MKSTLIAVLTFSIFSVLLSGCEKQNSHQATTTDSVVVKPEPRDDDEAERKQHEEVMRNTMKNFNGKTLFQ